MKMTKEKLKLINDAIKRVSKHEREPLLTNETVPSRPIRTSSPSSRTANPRRGLNIQADPNLDDLFSSPEPDTASRPTYTFSLPQGMSIDAEAISNQPGQVIAVEEAETEPGYSYNSLSGQWELDRRLNQVRADNVRRIAEIANGPTPEETQRNIEVNRLRDRYLEEMHRITRVQQEIAMPRWNIISSPEVAPNEAIMVATRDALIHGQGAVRVTFDEAGDIEDEEYNGN